MSDEAAGEAAEKPRAGMMSQLKTKLEYKKWRFSAYLSTSGAEKPPRLYMPFVGQNPRPPLIDMLVCVSGPPRRRPTD
jgi:hypothetical protein